MSMNISVMFSKVNDKKVAWLFAFALRNFWDELSAPIEFLAAAVQ